MAHKPIKYEGKIKNYWNCIEYFGKIKFSYLYTTNYPPHTFTDTHTYKGYSISLEKSHQRLKKVV